LFNYMSVESLIKENSKIKGVVVEDTLSKDKFSINGANVINATGVFSKSIMNMDSLKFKAIIRPSQGIHLVIDKKFLNGNIGILVPKTSDGRVLFAVPWLGHVILGTTDTLVNEPSIDPIPSNNEIDFILYNAQKYMSLKPTRKDVKSVFVGLRPLVAKDLKSKSKDISRKHKIIISDTGLVSVIGGKWTTYRKMAEKVIDKSIDISGLDFKKSITSDLKISNGLKNIDYSKDSLSEKFYLSENLIIYYIRNEMAINLDDIMSRRSRCLFLDIKESVFIAPKVVDIMAKELSKNNDWKKDQLKQFYKLTKIYSI
jgi:glycerol-3-phosphate dehydrogenase